MARARHVLLQEHAAVAKVAAGEPTHAVEGGAQLGLVGALLHADAAAAGGALEHHGIADALRFAAAPGADPAAGRCPAAAAGRWPRPAHAPCVCSPKSRICARRRADEGNAGALAVLGELRVLAQETIAGMDRLRAAGDRRLEDAVGTQVAVRGRSPPDQHRLLGIAHVQAAAVGLGIDRDRRDLQPAQACARCGRQWRRDWRSGLSRTTRILARRAVPARYQELRVVPQSDGKFSPPPRSESVSVSDCRRCRDC